MKRLLQMLTAAVACFCVATVLAEGVGAAYLVSSVGLGQEKLYRLLAVLHNVDVEAIRAKREAAKTPEHSEQLSPEEVLQARLKRDLHLDLRETALDKSLLELRTLEAKLKEERKRYDDLKRDFDDELEVLKKGALEKSLQEVQSTLEAIAPKQAKEQILRMLDEDDEAEAERAMTDVVTILKAMSLDKRKKIIAEFKSAEDAVRLHEILKEIRHGEPGVSLIQGTRDQVKGL